MTFCTKEKIKIILDFDYNLFGLKIHKKVDVNGSTYDEYIFCLILNNRKKKELTISQEKFCLCDVEFFGPITHFIKKNKCQRVEDLLEDEKLTIKMEKVQSTGRGFDKVPLWIFNGNSGSGKSFLAHKISDLTVFETDAHNTLPDVIDEDIVVLGNKHLYTINDIVPRAKNRDIIICTFQSMNNLSS